MKKYDVIVVGSGLVGVATAYELAKAGKSVALMDAGGLSAGASAGNTGLLLFEGETSGTIFDLCLDSLNRYKVLEDELEMPFGFRPMNFLGFFEKDEDLAIAKEQQAIYHQNGFPYEILSPEELSEKEPALVLDKNMGGAYYQQWVMDPLRLVYAYFKKAVSYGAEWFSHTKVTGFHFEDGAVKGVVTEKGDTYLSEQVVVAAGAWSTELMKTAGFDLPQFYIQGAAFVMERSSRVLKHTVSTFTSPRIGMEDRAGKLLKDCPWDELPEQNANEFIIVPDTNGNHVVAQRACVSSRDFPGVPHDYLRDMAKNVAKYLPSMKKDRVIRSWITPVPFVPDKKPFWGRVKNLENVVMATGFGSVLIMAPTLGLVTKQIVMNEPVKYDITPFDPNRKVW